MVGKPAKESYRLVLERVGLPAAVVGIVGDDISARGTFYVPEAPARPLY
ncbi:MAG: hypothetical protein V3U68_06380 [Bacteroidota bacterium]